MKPSEILLTGFRNLGRTKLRSGLTILGVVIGIASLVAMVALGSGLSKNVTDSFTKNDLFTSLQVNDKQSYMYNTEMSDSSAKRDTSSHLLNDKAMDSFRKIKGVIIVYPDIKFTADVNFRDKKSIGTVSVMPASVGKFEPYKSITNGHFFTDDNDSSVIISEHLLPFLGISLKEKGNEKATDIKRKRPDIKYLPADSIIGQDISIAVSPVSLTRFFMPGLPGVKHKSVRLRIRGIFKSDTPFGNAINQAVLIISPEMAKKIPGNELYKSASSSNTNAGSKTYSSVNIRLSDLKYIAGVKKEILKMGYRVIAFSDQLAGIKRSFIIIGSIFAAIGTIALIVAALGIINTMLMSVLERTREIGIMKAIGGSEGEIRSIFLTEAAAIGFIGALFGLLLGWSVTRVAGYFFGRQLISSGEKPIELFYFPAWLILGAIAFAVLISVLSGMYPARRASRINPVIALRHD
ncbi:MAG: FtsX-like permease family protein [Bacteroidia bacterium]|nr:FtsX-like permease family protein [Bacteroidia bacterium]